MAPIELVRVSKRFGARAVLHDVSLTMARGEFVSIVGTMGSGKSTLVGIVAGLIQPDAGEVRAGGTPLSGVRRDAAIVFQSLSLFPWLSALDNVRLAVGAAFPAESPRQHLDRARSAVTRVGLGSAEQRRPSQLSGGMRQRVAIARALATEPDVLLLDEPFSALDALTRATLQLELMKLCANATRPVTTLMITNSVEEALLLSDRIVPLTRGPRATLGAPVDVALPRPRSPAALTRDERAIRLRGTIIETLARRVFSEAPVPSIAAARPPAAWPRPLQLAAACVPWLRRSPR